MSATMKHSVLALSLAALSAFAAALAGAEVPPVPTPQTSNPATGSAGQTLTLTQARALAVAHSRTLQLLVLSVESARVDERIQSYSGLPSITASASTGVENPTGTSTPALTIANAVNSSASLTVSQTVFDGTLSIRGAIDALSTSIAREKARAEYFSVLAAADSAFYGVQKAQSAVTAAQADLENSRAHQQLAQGKLDTGTITRSDLLESEANTAAKEATLAQANGSLSVARRKLASLTGASPGVALAEADPGLTGEPPSGGDLLSEFATLSSSQVDSLIGQINDSASRSPTLMQTILARQQASRSVDLAKAGYLPNVGASASGGVSYRSGSGSLTGALTLSVSVSLDMWKTVASVESKSIAERQASLSLQETRRTLALSVEEAVYNAVSSAQSVVASRKALEYAQSHYAGVLERYRLSAASSSDLSDAELLLSTNRTSLISARYAFLGNISDLLNLAGFESEDSLAALLRQGTGGGGPAN